MKEKIKIVDIVNAFELGLIERKQAEKKLFDLCGVSQQSELLPFDFIKWYSGMEESKIRNAYDRWLKEKGNCG